MRFSNPYLALPQLQIVSRADLCAEDEHPNRASTGDIESLQTLLSATLWPKLKYSRDELHFPRAKRRKVEKDATSQNTVSFRLVSVSLPPLPISLLPPPPPLPISREPEAEDNEAQALSRTQRSEAVAIDGTTILLGAKSPKELIIQTPIPAPPMLVITKQQPLRKTRPPVPSSELVYHPYVSRGRTNPAALPRTTICPMVDLESSGPKFKSSRRQRRKRLEESTRQRPPPRFWRPDPSWSGPCRGYAFGYPSSFGGGVYQRDRMKKAILLNSQNV